MIPSFVGLAFGILWLLAGVQATPSPWNLVTGIVGGLLFLAAAFRIRFRSVRGGRFRLQWYLAAVAAEVVAIMAVQAWLVAHRRTDLLPPAAGVIVGLHFIGLWRAMGLWRFNVLAAMLVAINLAALLLPLGAPGRQMLSGYGSAAALLLVAAA